MDYRRQPLIFKLRKVARYVRLYGPRRTLVKVQSQYRLRLPRPPRALPSVSERYAAPHIGIIGCGNFAYTTVAYFLSRAAGRVIHGAMDIDYSRAASLAHRYDVTYATNDARQLIEDPVIDLIYVASNHASHAAYAVEARKAGKHVHIEKPHIVSDGQLVQLCRAMERTSGRVALGFNRPESPLGREVMRLLARQTGPMMLNWFIAGHELPRNHWYFEEREGGRVLGNLCHWTDFVLRSVPRNRRYPIEIHPTRAEQSDADISVSYVFGDGSIATITFSAKGHAFEGVKEHLSAHRGDLILGLDDFKTLSVHVGPQRFRSSLIFRDHGHEARIIRSYGMSRRANSRTPGCAVPYVWETGQLFLSTRRALDERRMLLVHRFDPTLLREPSWQEVKDDSVPTL